MPSGRPQLLIDQYYQPASNDYRRVIRRASLANIPALFLIEQLQILKIDYEDPDRPGNFNFIIVEPGSDSFKHNPIKKLGLETDEELLAVQAKRRTVIVLSEQPVEVDIRGMGPREQDFLECYAVGPLYTFGDKYPAEFKAHIVAFRYPQFFYLPPDPEHGIRESFVRLDRIQMVARELLLPKPTYLSRDAQQLFNEWLVYYLTGELKDYLRELIAELQAGLDRTKQGTN